MKAAAESLGVPVSTPAKLQSFAAEFAPDSFDLFALASYGRILPQALLDLPRLGALNVHPSLLPRYRGATPIQSALRNGDTVTGVSIMLMDAGMDTGPIVAQTPVTVEPGETYGALHDRLAETGARMLECAFELAAGGALARHPQQGTPSVTRPTLKSDLEIDWSWPPVRIVDWVRAYAPQPAARAVVEGEMVKVLRAHVDAGGRLCVDELIAPSRPATTGAEYLRRRGLPPDTFEKLRGR